MTTFYRFLDNTAHNRNFTWAAEVYPTSEVVETKCQICGARERIPSGSFEVITEGGSKFPDVLGCGAYPFLIVSGAVINDWKVNNITSFQLYDVTVKETTSKRLKSIEPPQYYRVEIGGKCTIDFEASGLIVESICSNCGHFSTTPSAPNGFRMVPDSWDGSTLFRDAAHYPRVSFCTNLVLALARQFRHTNFRFDLMEGPFDYTTKGLEYLSSSQS